MYTHVIEFEQHTKFVGWQKCTFRTNEDALPMHLVALAIRTHFGHVRNVCVGLAALHA